VLHPSGCSAGVIDMSTTTVVTSAPSAEPRAQRRPVGLARARFDFILMVVVVGLAALVPFALPNASLLGVLAVMCIWIVVNVSWSVVLGYAGILSFGQLAFFAVGAYVSAILSVHTKVSPWLDTVAAIGAGGLAALLVGLAVLRLRGVYVALVTLAFHELLQTMISSDYSGLTGGPNGLLPVRPYLPTHNLLVQSAIGYWIGLGAVLVVAIAALMLVRSPIGLALVAGRDAEHVARARGVRITHYRLVAFVFSGAAGGLGGALYGHYNSTVSPQIFDFGILMMLLSMIIIGGWATTWGPIVGTVVVTVIVYYVQGVWPGAENAVAAGLMVIAILFLRGGLIGAFGELSARVRAAYRRRGPTGA
jgi:branched-chain amino acid transport system permease protein